MMSKSLYIAIEGVIGVGKTTLARLLQSRYDAGILLEVFEENPFLPRFYQDRERYAFQTQIFFLLSRYHQQYQAVPAALDRGMLISDYTFAKDELFAWLNLKDDELAMYGRVHAALGEKIPRPDLIVYLRADHDVLMRRIALRDRPYERDMDPGYIRELASAYEAWLSRMSDVPVLTIDTDELDFLSRPADLEYVHAMIDWTLASLETSGGRTPAAQLRTLQQGRIGALQALHRELDAGAGFDPDLFYNTMVLVEAVGSVATEMSRVWTEGRRMAASGLPVAEAYEQAIGRRRLALRDQLAEMLADLMKLANVTGIDLEQAYAEKMTPALNGHGPVAESTS